MAALAGTIALGWTKFEIRCSSRCHMSAAAGHMQSALSACLTLHASVCSRMHLDGQHHFSVERIEKAQFAPWRVAWNAKEIQLTTRNTYRCRCCRVDGVAGLHVRVCSHASADFTLLNAGVGLAACPEGLRVTEIVPNGAAYKSGRICVDDILISIDGHHVCALFAYIIRIYYVLIW